MRFLKIFISRVYFQWFMWRLHCFSKVPRFDRHTLHSSRWINLLMLVPSDKASDSQVTFSRAILMDHIDMLLWGISPDSSQCSPVSQVNSWKHLHIIHHSLVPPQPALPLGEPRSTHDWLLAALRGITCMALARTRTRTGWPGRVPLWHCTVL